MNTSAGREKLPMKVLRPFVSVGDTRPDFPAPYLQHKMHSTSRGFPKQLSGNYPIMMTVKHSITAGYKASVPLSVWTQKMGRHIITSYLIYYNKENHLPFF